MKKLIYLFLALIIVAFSSDDNNCEMMTTIIADCECSDINTYTVFITTVDEENCEI